MELLGGLLFQVIITLVTVVAFSRSSQHSLPFTFYRTENSLVNVSVYVGDAPY